MAAASAPPSAPRSKKRKRRRGRKVFARDGAPQPAMAGPAAAPSESLPRPPEPSLARPAAGACGRRIAPAGCHELPVFAALDLGTNNCRLLVAVPTRPGQFRVVDAFSRIVRLGEGLSASGRLGEAAMDRGDRGAEDLRRQARAARRPRARG